VPHLLRHGTSVFKVISERPVILTSKCRAHGEGAITTYFTSLGLTRLARAGLKLTTYRLLSESSTTRLRQLVASKSVEIDIMTLRQHVMKMCKLFFLNGCIL
jgi:hypothetical protein